MRIRLRAPAGVSTLTFEDDATVADLRSQIKEKTSLTKYDMRYGYPPKALTLGQDSALLSSLDVKLNDEQLIISSQESSSDKLSTSTVTTSKERTAVGKPSSNKHSSAGPSDFSFPGASNQNASSSLGETNFDVSNKSSRPIPLKHKTRDEKDVPEIPIPERGATLVMRVMPDDNSCLFRAFGTAVVPGDDLSMPELRSLVAAQIQSDPDTYSKVVLEQEPSKYCRWIQTEEAWGGAIELGILSSHFDIEICSIDVQSLRVDKFNEGRPTRCILVYSGIHYDNIVLSPSDYPNTKAQNPPEFDTRVFDSDDDRVLIAALELCRKLKDQHYFTDTGGMAIRCEVCKWVGYGQGQASQHAEHTGHYDMQEVQTIKK